MADCTIFKRHVGYSVPWGGEKPIAIRKWVAVCPTCFKELKPSVYNWQLQNSRKAAKDALVTHRKFYH
jgi:hypothetical protein